jgi:hypothetical protein
MDYLKNLKKTDKMGASELLSQVASFTNFKRFKTKGLFGVTRKPTGVAGKWGLSDSYKKLSQEAKDALNKNLTEEIKSENTLKLRMKELEKKLEVEKSKWKTEVQTCVDGHMKKASETQTKRSFTYSDGKKANLTEKEYMNLYSKFKENKKEGAVRSTNSGSGSRSTDRPEISHEHEQEIFKSMEKLARGGDAGFEKVCNSSQNSKQLKEKILKDEK